LENPEYARTAEKAATFVLAKLRDPQGRLLHSYTNGQPKLNAYLDDYAFLIDGLLALHEATDDVKWLKSAKQLQDDQLRLFLDEANGGFYFTSHHHEELLARTKNCYDGVMPAGNSVSARNLIKLAKRTGADAYRDEARATIELFASNLEQSPRGFANLALAASEFLESEVGEKEGANETKNEIIPVAAADEKVPANDPLVPLAEQKEEKKADRPKKGELIKASVYLSTDKLPAGGSCDFQVLLDVNKGWHINANPPSRDYLIPTSVTFKSKLEAKLTDVKYPEGHGFKFEGEEMEVLVYEGKVAIRGKLVVPEKAGGQTDEMEIVIKYQACNDVGCQPPSTIKLAGKLAVAKRGEAVKTINARLFAPAANAPK
jgi:hypothetical protein